VGVVTVGVVTVGTGTVAAGTVVVATGVVIPTVGVVTATVGVVTAGGPGRPSASAAPASPAVARHAKPMRTSACRRIPLRGNGRGGGAGTRAAPIRLRERGCQTGCDVTDAIDIDGLEEEARHRALLAAIPDLMFRLRRDGTYLEFAGDLSGLATPADELVGSRVEDILRPDVAAPFMAAVEAAATSGEPATAEYVLTRLTDGAVREFEARLVPVAANGEEVVAIVRDVTDARRLTREQDALRRVATLVATAAREDEVVALIAAELGALFDADAANALRWDGAALHLLAEWRRDGGAPAPGSVYSYGGDTISARVVVSGGPARIDSFEELATEFARERWRDLGIEASIGAPVRVRDQVWGVVTASRATGRIRFPDGAEQRLADFAALLAQAIENVESRRQMAQLLDEQSTLRQIATLVAGGRPPAEVLESVTAEVARVFAARSVEVVRWEGVPDEIAVVEAWAAAPGSAAEAGTTRHEPPGSAIIDVLEHGLAAIGHGSEATVAAPLIINGVLRGVLAAHRDATEPYAPGDEARLRAFADLAAQSVGNDRVQHALRESRARIVRAGDEARRRLERNLHDGAQQRLVAVSMQLRHAATLFDADAARARELVASATAELQNAMQELRDLARGLHPAILSEQGLESALRALVRRTPGDTVLENEVTERLPDAVEAAAYYVVAEALTNASKYARSESVHVSVCRDGESIVLEVRDRGLGGATVSAGSGLQGLMDRVEAIGGRLDVQSPAGIGTTIRAVIPAAP
jgi:PAS domain S-box-containing protein